MGANLVKYEKGELVVHKIEINDITNLVSAEEGLSNLQKAVSKTYRKALEDAVNGASTRITKRRFLSHGEYDYLDTNFFNKTYIKINDQIVKELFPEELLRIREYQSGITNVYRKFENIKEESNIFLRYFFVTPVNEAGWKRFLEEVVPVSESTSFLFNLFSQTSVRPFKKTTYEQGSAEIENMQMVPSLLEEDDIEFYVSRISQATQDYNIEIKRYVEMLSKFTIGRMQLSPLFARDIKIMNSSLERLVKKPYSQLTGLYAIRLNTAILRIQPELKKITDSLKEISSNFLQMGNLYRGDFGRIAKNSGFDVRYEKDWLGYGADFRKPKYALRKVEN